jgi:hypothetical protein
VNGESKSPNNSRNKEVRIMKDQEQVIVRNIYENELGFINVHCQRLNYGQERVEPLDQEVKNLILLKYVEIIKNKDIGLQA